MCQSDGGQGDDFMSMPPADQKVTIFDFITQLDLDDFSSVSSSEDLEGTGDESVSSGSPLSPNHHICNHWKTAFADAAYDEFPDRVRKANDFFMGCATGMQNVINAYRNLAHARSQYDIDELMISSGCESDRVGCIVAKDMEGLETETPEAQTAVCLGFEVVSLWLFKGASSQRQLATMHLGLCAGCQEAAGVIQRLTNIDGS